MLLRLPSSTVTEISWHCTKELMTALGLPLLIRWAVKLVGGSNDSVIKVVAISVASVERHQELRQFGLESRASFTHVLLCSYLQDWLLLL